MTGGATLALTSFAATSLALPLVVWGLRARAIVDVPNERSSHSGRVVRGAGVGLAIGVLVALALGSALSEASVIVVLGFAALGAADDVKSMPAGLRLILQVGLATVVCVAAINMGSVSAAWIVLGAALVVAATNAVNFMDGVNGITALHALVWGVTFMVILRDSSNPGYASLAIALAASAVAFLPWNLLRARAFLGDSGSYFIGASVGLLALVSWAQWGPVVALCPLAVYAADTSTTVVRRWRAKASMFQAHHEHTYQRLLELGWSHLQSALAVTISSALCCALSVAAMGRSTVFQLGATLGVATICLAYVWLPTAVSTRSHGALQAGERHA